MGAGEVKQGPWFHIGCMGRAIQGVLEVQRKQVGLARMATAYPSTLFFFFFFVFQRFYLFLERGEGREKDRERNINA